MSYLRSFWHFLSFFDDFFYIVGVFLIKGAVQSAGSQQEHCGALAEQCKIRASTYNCSGLNLEVVASIKEPQSQLQREIWRKPKERAVRLRAICQTP